MECEDVCKYLEVKWHKLLSIHCTVHVPAGFEVAFTCVCKSFCLNSIYHVCIRFRCASTDASNGQEMATLSKTR
jgi:hypothetical protein